MAIESPTIAPRSTNRIPPAFVCRKVPWLLKFVTSRSSRPSPFTSSASVAMAPVVRPDGSKATSASRATSRKRPSPRFRKRKLGAESFVWKTSIHPSSSRSAATTPMPFPTREAMPALALASSNVPSPRFR